MGRIFRTHKLPITKSEIKKENKYTFSTERILIKLIVYNPSRNILPTFKFPRNK
ncbi:hypothetical protein IYO1511_c10020 [Lactiplantibacillus plantarum]|nr:hypothetical protein IYO1511_c10020 [Lactiplantibacillus plantarum]